MDLLGRKVTMKKGAAAKIYLEEIQKAVEEASVSEDLKLYASQLDEAVTLWKTVTNGLLGIAAKGEIDLFLADATLYLEFSGIICLAWQWLMQGIAVMKMIQNSPSGNDMNFAEGKMFTMKYFFEYELTKIQGLSARLKNADGLTLKMKPEFFED